MWPFGKSRPKPTRAEARAKILSDYADCLEHSWSVGAVRSTRSLRDNKELIKLVLINSLREARSGPRYDILWSAAMQLPAFQEISEAEEASLKYLARVLANPTGVDRTNIDERANTGMKLAAELSARVVQESDRLTREFAGHGLHKGGSRD